MYSKTTHDILVNVEVIYLEEQSQPSQHHYMWAYRVRIENMGKESVRLIGRHWKITDALGRLHEFYGEGVIGQTPTLAPHEPFEYTSGTPLSTPSGIMAGNYTMLAENGKEFSVEIPAFSLDSPHQITSLH
ncbi:MAG: Co2+/Mg2+ efflux protein ApaG [Alphaproteobacteria bacterium 16-39-46]|nr:MAG: Co2+/Mg2+ efflux protein ApaG [Alphaproteobacteria bacterium 16-39-46]OZA43587.1 MAG: Co2+/Mg2+ efflux protein ApaG [Alphaproteobacteria bacterium 17-39-52]HQS83762.1 Co2+/Mg2+ efflux protein ApaG [Alphaproteobacteria bacterium]HQS93528.1 Co2+/Mg2+ efflux protein ApaG [Alphaproteobacteria bacterium]